MHEVRGAPGHEPNGVFVFCYADSFNHCRLSTHEAALEAGWPALLPAMRPVDDHKRFCLAAIWPPDRPPCPQFSKVDLRPIVSGGVLAAANLLERRIHNFIVGFARLALRHDVIIHEEFQIVPERQRAAHR